MGDSISVEIQFASKLLSASLDEEILDVNELNQLATLCHHYTIRKEFSKFEYLKLKKTTVGRWNSTKSIRQLNLDSQDFDRIFSALLQLCQAFRRNARQASNLKEELLNTWRIPENVINVLYGQFFADPESCSTLGRNAIGNRLHRIRWRLDLEISDRDTTKIMEPVIWFELEYSNSEHRCTAAKRILFKCRLSQFHRLRFVTANLLRELIQLESNKHLH